MTVNDVFSAVHLSPQGPVAWETPISEYRQGVYVVARSKDPSARCKPRNLPLASWDSLHIVINIGYERQRWLPTEPVLYIGQNTRPLRDGIMEFYSHSVGIKSRHAGGQVVKLLACTSWVYWAHTARPKDAEKRMLSAFRKATGHLPYANGERGKPKRIQLRQ